MLQYGNDGDPNGLATQMTGVGSTINTSGLNVWDSNLTDGLDSGWQNVALTLNTKFNGLMSLKVGLSSTQSFNTGSPLMSIGSITIRADVQNAFMQMDWRNITVKFYSGSSVVETDPMPDIEASTMDGSSVQESGAILKPNASNITGVSISAQVRLQSVPGVTPLPSDIFGQVLVG
jgi:hypothetical protein